LLFDDGICKTQYPVPDTIAEIQIDLDNEAEGIVAILSDGLEMLMDDATLETVRHYFPDVPIRERFDFVRWLKRL
jgi:hypothetical protein